MSKRIYICNECGFHFPTQLSGLIEDNIQVYCEKCGTPFSLAGVKFIERKFKPEIKLAKPHKKEFILEKGENGEKWEKKKKETYPVKKEKTYSTINKVIQKFNEFSYIPILIVSILSLILLLQIFQEPDLWLVIVIRHSSIGLFGLLLSLYDKKVVYKRIKEGKYEEVIVHSISIGILGCFLYGTGVFLLAKGVLVLIYVILISKKNKYTFYDIAHFIKNSLNEFSSILGFILIIFAIHIISRIDFYFEFEIFIRNLFVVGFESPEAFKDFLMNNFFISSVIGSLIGAIICLSIDFLYRKKIHNKQKVEITVVIRTFILGIIATIFCAVGIFILVKAAILLMLVIIQTKFIKEKEKIKGTKELDTEDSIYLSKIDELDIIEMKKDKIKEEIVKIGEEQTKTKEEEPIKDIIKEEIVKISKEETKTKDEIKKKEEEIELKLHESLIPVKNKKDKKLVKEYFSKIFTLLSKDIREQIINLKIPKRDKNELLKELAFLTKEQQVKYIKAIINLYQEKIPRKLVERIRKLPKVKPEHYNKIVEQLKYMDEDEQVKYVQFLEKYA